MQIAILIHGRIAEHTTELLLFGILKKGTLVLWRLLLLVSCAVVVICDVVHKERGWHWIFTNLGLYQALLLVSTLLLIILRRFLSHIGRFVSDW